MSSAEESAHQGAFGRAVDAVHAGGIAEERADVLLALLTAGYNERPYHHGRVDRLGIPGTRFVDVDVSRMSLAESDPVARRRVPPTLDAVMLEVGVHAHDPVAAVIEGGSA